MHTVQLCIADECFVALSGPLDFRQEMRIYEMSADANCNTEVRRAGLQTDAKRLWKLNEALSLGILAPQATLYTTVAPPIQQLPHLRWQPDRAFHTSALCAAVLDSVTLPYRLHTPSPTSPLGPATGILLFLRSYCQWCYGPASLHYNRLVCLQRLGLRSYCVMCCGHLLTASWVLPPVCSCDPEAVHCSKLFLLALLSFQVMLCIVLRCILWS